MIPSGESTVQCERWCEIYSFAENSFSFVGPKHPTPSAADTLPIENNATSVGSNLLMNVLLIVPISGDQ